MGTPEFAVPSLEALLDAGLEVTAVVTAPDKPAGRSLQLRASPVKRSAEKYELPVWQPENLSEPHFLEQLRMAAADIGVVVAFRILPPELFTIPRLGCVNLHASLLPELRGAAPINWALIRGLKQTGVTTFLIEKRVDTGQILLQKETPILPDDDADSLGARLAEEGAQLLVRTVQDYARGILKPHTQSGNPTSAPKLTPETCRINWGESADDIHNLVRGLAPAPAAWTTLVGMRVKIYRVRPVNLAPQSPGVIVPTAGGGMVIACGNGGIEPLEMQMEGRRRMSDVELRRGLRLQPGAAFR